MVNKIEAKIGKRIKAPAFDVYGVQLHEATIKFWPAQERRGRKISEVAT